MRVSNTDQFEPFWAKSRVIWISSSADCSSQAVSQSCSPFSDLGLYKDQNKKKKSTPYILPDNSFIFTKLGFALFGFILYKYKIAEHLRRLRGLPYAGVQVLVVWFLKHGCKLDSLDLCLELVDEWEDVGVASWRGSTAACITSK